MYIKGNQGIILNPKAVWIEEVNDGVDIYADSEDYDCFLISRHLTEKNAMYELENIFRNMLIQSGHYED